jgi:hypothetical protein
MAIGIGIGIPFKRGAAFAFTAGQAPTLLVATTIDDTQIDLAWTSNSAGVEDGFSIERSTDGITYAEIDTVLAGVVVYSDTTCVAGTLYYYRVRAYIT